MTKSPLRFFSSPTKYFFQILNHLGEEIEQCLQVLSILFKNVDWARGTRASRAAQRVVLLSCLRFFPVQIFETEACAQWDPSILFSGCFRGCAVPGAWLALLSLSVHGEHCLWVYGNAFNLGEPSLPSDADHTV